MSTDSLRDLGCGNPRLHALLSSPGGRTVVVWPAVSPAMSTRGASADQVLTLGDQPAVQLASEHGDAFGSGMVPEPVAGHADLAAAARSQNVLIQIGPALAVFCRCGSGVALRSGAGTRRGKRHRNPACVRLYWQGWGGIGRVRGLVWNWLPGTLWGLAPLSLLAFFQRALSFLAALLQRPSACPSAARPLFPRSPLPASRSTPSPAAVTTAGPLI